MSTTDYSSPDYPIVLPSRLITSQADFTAWVHSDDFPQQGRVTYLQGRVEIDMRPERLEGHTKLKNQLAMVLQNLTAKNDLGHFYGDGARFSNADAGLSCEPDALFFTHETWKSGRIRPEGVSLEESLGFEGSPDWVLEVVSPNSRKKDKQDLRSAYYDAGIAEYWIVDTIDATKEIEFLVLVRGDGGFVPMSAREGWYASPDFGCSFRLSYEVDSSGFRNYSLEVR